MVTATADDAAVATELERYLAQMHRSTGKVPSQRAARIHKDAPKAEASPIPDGFFTEDIRAQLEGVFSKMATPLTLVAELDERPVSRELKGFCKN